jgi:hypothetical protein
MRVGDFLDDIGGAASGGTAYTGAEISPVGTMIFASIYGDANAAV